jgi:hypothetical protein
VLYTAEVSNHKITQSIGTLVNTDNTEVVNKQINKSKSRLVNLTSYRNGNLVVDATSVAVHSSRIQKENKYHSEHRQNRLVTITTENHNHLTIGVAGLSGDNDDRECERWKESHKSFYCGGERQKCFQLSWVFNCELLKGIRYDLDPCNFRYFWILLDTLGYD